MSTMPYWFNWSLFIYFLLEKNMNTFITGAGGVTQESVFGTLFVLTLHGYTNTSTHYKSHLATRKMKDIDRDMLMDGQSLRTRGQGGQRLWFIVKKKVVKGIKLHFN